MQEMVPDRVLNPVGGSVTAEAQGCSAPKVHVRDGVFRAVLGTRLECRPSLSDGSETACPVTLARILECPDT
jgi:hypothetical protein